MKYFNRTAMAAIIVAMVIALAGCGGADERKDAYLQKAKDSFAAGDYEKSKVDLRNVLQIDPKHSNATYILGKIAEVKKEYVSALGLYRKAVLLDGNNIDARYSLGKFYLQLAETDKTISEIDSIDEVSPGSDYAKALRAGVAFSEKKYKDAIDYARSIKNENREEDVYILLSASYYGIGDKALSKQTLLDGIKQHTKSIQLRSVLARTYVEEENKDDAIRYLKEIIALEPDNITHYIVLSSYYEKLDDTISAKKVYVDLIESDPKNEDYQLLMIRYIASRSGEEEALKYLVNLVSEQPDVDTFLIVLAKFELKKGNKEEGIALLEKVIKRQFTEKGTNTAKNILAGIKERSGDLAGAKKLLNEILQINPSDTNANFSMGKILLAENNPGDAVGPLRITIREDIKNSEAYILLATAHERLHESDLAYDVISHGVKEIPNNQAIIDIYVRMLLQKGEHKFAMDVIDNVSKDVVITPGGKFLRAEVYLANGEFKKSEALAIELIDAYPDKHQGYLVLAETSVRQGNIVKARDILKKGIEKTGSPKVLADYIKTQVRLGAMDDALNFLQNYSEHKPVAYSLIAELYALKNNDELAQQYYRKAIELEPKWDAPYIALALFQRKHGDISGAIETYNAAIDKIDDANKIRLMLAATYQATGKIEESVNIYKFVIEQEPGNIMAINNFAIALVDNYQDKARFSEALNLVEKIKANASPAVLDTVAWVYVKNEKYNEGIQIFNDIIKKNPDVGIFKYHIGMAYYSKGDSVLAKRYLEEAVSIGGEDTWINDAKIKIDELNKA